jgi:glycosyltransferase involved in cell wall biosynthesis
MESGAMSQPAKNRISVAMCTYNGEQFLAQQLASMAQQSRPPDELIVCDDRSTDHTVAMIREFAASVRYPVRVFENEHNLGVAANFDRAIRLCEGNLIALADQDDIWYPIRLERSEQELTAHPQAGLIFSDADIIDDNNQSTGATLWQRLSFVGKREQDLLAGRYLVLAKHRFVTGATVMMRAGLRDRCLPIGEGWIHDEWITMISAAFCDLKPIAQPLIQYRIHASQQIGFQNKFEQRTQGASRAAKHWERLAESVKELEQLCDALSAMTLDEEREVLPAYRDHLQFLSFRANLPGRRLMRVGPVLAHYSQYGVHASGLASVLKDIAFRRQRT